MSNHNGAAYHAQRAVVAARLATQAAHRAVYSGNSATCETFDADLCVGDQPECEKHPCCFWNSDFGEDGGFCDYTKWGRVESKVNLTKTN